MMQNFTVNVETVLSYMTLTKAAAHLCSSWEQKKQNLFSSKFRLPTNPNLCPAVQKQKIWPKAWEDAHLDLKCSLKAHVFKAWPQLCFLGWWGLVGGSGGHCGHAIKGGFGT